MEPYSPIGVKFNLRLKSEIGLVNICRHGWAKGVVEVDFLLLQLDSSLILLHVSRIKIVRVETNTG